MLRIHLSQWPWLGFCYSLFSSPCSVTKAAKTSAMPLPCENDILTSISFPFSFLELSLAKSTNLTGALETHSSTADHSHLAKWKYEVINILGQGGWDVCECVCHAWHELRLLAQLIMLSDANKSHHNSTWVWCSGMLEQARLPLMACNHFNFISVPIALPRWFSISLFAQCVPQHRLRS